MSSNFTFTFFGGCTTCLSYDIYTRTTFGLCLLVPWGVIQVLFHSPERNDCGASPSTTDLTYYASYCENNNAFNFSYRLKYAAK